MERTLVELTAKIPTKTDRARVVGNIRCWGLLNKTMGGTLTINHSMAPLRGELDPVSNTMDEIRRATQGMTLETIFLETRKIRAEETNDKDAISQSGRNQLGIVEVKKSVQYPVPTKAWIRLGT